MRLRCVVVLWNGMVVMSAKDKGGDEKCHVYKRGKVWISGIHVAQRTHLTPSQKRRNERQMKKKAIWFVSIRTLTITTCHDVTWDPTRRHTSKQADTTIYDCASRCGKFLPYVRLPKYGAMPPLRPFELCDSSFESPWRLKLYSTSLNLQIGVVVEIKPS